MVINQDDDQLPFMMPKIKEAQMLATSTPVGKVTATFLLGPKLSSLSEDGFGQSRPEMISTSSSRLCRIL
jgi:hypothetical protein